MPVRLRLDRGDIDALAAWIREQLDDSALGTAHTAMLNEIVPHLHADTAAGGLARRVLQFLGAAYRHRGGYREVWLPSPFQP